MLSEDLVAAREKHQKKSKECAQKIMSLIKDLHCDIDQEHIDFITMRLDNLMYIAYIMSQASEETGSLGPSKELINFLLCVSAGPRMDTLLTLGDLSTMIDFAKLKNSDLSGLGDDYVISRIKFGASVGEVLDARMRSAAEMMIEDVKEEKKFSELH